MRLMIIVKATKDSEARVMPEEKLIAAMATYNLRASESRRAARSLGTASER